MEGAIAIRGRPPHLSLLTARWQVEGQRTAGSEWRAKNDSGEAACSFALDSTYFRLRSVFQNIPFWESLLGSKLSIILICLKLSIFCGRS